MENREPTAEGVDRAMAGDGNGGRAAATDPEAPENAMDALAQERDRFRELAIRTRAEFENYQKRVTRDLQAERQYAVQPLATDLLPVLDNLDRAIESASSNADSGGILEGVQMVRKHFLDTFAKHGIEALRPEGVPFDPNQHQAVMQYPTTDFPPMTVLRTFQAGYKLRDRVIRPAQVLVAVAPPAEGDAPAEPGPAAE